MKKILTAMVLFTMVSLFSIVTTFAVQPVDTATTITLDGRARFSVSLKSNKLVFANEPIDREYESIVLNVGNGNEIVRTVTYVRGQGNGITIDLNGLADGTYGLSVDDVLYGQQSALADCGWALIVIKGGNASFQLEGHLAETLKLVANERTDEYALDSHKYSSGLSLTPVYIKKAKEITEGITDDYEKIRAIYSWTREHVIYSFDAFSDSGVDSLYSDEVVTYVDSLDLGVDSNACIAGKCGTYALVTQSLAQAAGFPAKMITGCTNNMEPHAWTEIYVDNRWVYIDSSWDEFDLPVSLWARTHINTDIAELDANLWEGSLYFYDINNDKVLKEIPNFPAGGLVTSTYGFNLNDLYEDNLCTKHFTLNTMRVVSNNHVIIVKRQCEYIVNFDSNGGTPVKSMLVLAPKDEFYAKLPKPADPKKEGYTFIGWGNGLLYDPWVWNFKEDVLSSRQPLLLTARWKKTNAKSVEYTITFKTNGGAEVNSFKAIKNTKLNSPTAPTRSGYKFAGWYKDSKYTKVWNFATDKVTANTVLYAGWQKV